jgi:signal transduction histidine kinase
MTLAERLYILLVEDNPGDRALVREYLPRTHVLREAATGAEARAALEARRPDLALLDYSLPDVDGLVLLADFAAYDVPVVMLTGMEATAVAVEAMRAGAQHYLLKGDLTPDALEHAIGHVVAQAALHRAVAEQQRLLALQAAALEAKNREISALAGALTLAEQAERRRLAGLLHDGLQQLLFGAKLGLATVLNAADAEDRQCRAEAVERVLDEAIATTRTLALELTPPVLDRENLGVALEWLGKHVGEQYGLEVTIRAGCDDRIPSHEVRVLLVQLVRELLFNVVKHAGVTRTEVALERREDYLVLTVIDEGRGFDPSALEARQGEGGLGLYSVRERLQMLGGRLEITSRPGGGTRVSIYAPARVGASGGFVTQEPSTVTA